MRKICHRTMGSAKKEECIEQACTAWGVISFTIPTDKEHEGGPGIPFAEEAAEPVYGCRDVE